jgi:hypothetical protein
VQNKTEAAKDKPLIGRMEIHDSLLSISFLARALAEKVLYLPTGREEQEEKEDC